MSKSSATKIAVVRPQASQTGRISGTHDGGFAPRTTSVKGEAVGIGKGFAPTTTNVKGPNSGKK